MAAETEELVRRFYEDVLVGGDLAALDELATSDYEEHEPLPGQGDGRQGLKDRVSMLREGLAPRFTIEDVIGEGDRLVVRWTNSGTHVGDFLGIPATNKSFSVAGIDIYRVADGKLAEHWHVVDQLSMLQQLGLIPAPEGAGA
ncbi:MAG: ester cyclase [Actinobacteria bacterium]|nr:ester cyclase [Actinomycetota bacterium]